MTLITIGAFFIAQKQSPAFARWVFLNTQWPLNLAVAGLLISIVCLFFSVPGCSTWGITMAGVGGIIYYQKITGSDAKIWAYTWALIPLFIGMGFLQDGLINDGGMFNDPPPRRHSGMEEALLVGSGLIVGSTVLFIILATFIGKLQLFGVSGILLLTIPTGVWLIVRSIHETIRGERAHEGKHGGLHRRRSRNSLRSSK